MYTHGTTATDIALATIGNGYFTPTVPVPGTPPPSSVAVIITDGASNNKSVSLVILGVDEEEIGV